MIRTYSQMHDTDEYSKHSSIICSVWLNGWVFVYELSGCGFESSCSHLNFRFSTCFKQGVPSHSGNYRVWIHSEMRTWLDKNIQSHSFTESGSSFIYVIPCITISLVCCCFIECSNPNCFFRIWYHFTLYQFFGKFNFCTI